MVEWWWSSDWWWSGDGTWDLEKNWEWWCTDISGSERTCEILHVQLHKLLLHWEMWSSLCPAHHVCNYTHSTTMSCHPPPALAGQHFPWLQTWAKICSCSQFESVRCTRNLLNMLVEVLSLRGSNFEVV